MRARSTRAASTYPITGVYYNKAPGGADRHDRAARHARGVRGLAGGRQGGRPPADHAVERLGERRRPRLPAPEPDGIRSARPGPSTSGSTRRRAPRSTRRPTWRPLSTSSSGSRRATSPRTSTPSSTPRRAHRFAGGEGVFTFNGDWQNAHVRRHAPTTSGSSCSRRPTEGGAHGSMGVPVTYGIAANAKNAGLRRVLPGLGRHQPGGSRQINVTSRAPPRSGRPTCPSRRSRRAPSRTRPSPPPAWSAAENGLMDFIANATGDIFAGRWLDAGAPEPGRRPADARGPAPDASRPSYEEELAQ